MTSKNKISNFNNTIFENFANHNKQIKEKNDKLKDENNITLNAQNDTEGNNIIRSKSKDVQNINNLSQLLNSFHFSDDSKKKNIAQTMSMKEALIYSKNAKQFYNSFDKGSNKQFKKILLSSKKSVNSNNIDLNNSFIPKLNFTSDKDFIFNKY